MLSKVQECKMELALKNIPVSPVETIVEQPEKVDEPKPEVSRKKYKKIRKELHAKILKLMEFYFGDENLSKDRYLEKLIDEDPWVDLSIFIAFKKIKILTTDVSRIAKALKKSTMLDVSADGTKVRRTTPIREKNNSEECTVYVQKLPPDADHDWISKLLSQYGPIDYISIPKYKNKAIKGFAFVEYKTPEDAQNCIKAFRAKGCELSPQTSPNFLMSIITHEDCDEDITKDSKSQVPQNGNERKKKRIFIDVTTSIKMEKEHRRGRKRRGRNSESLNASNGNYELNDSSSSECDKKLKKIKHEPSESESIKQSVQEMKILPEEAICNNPKKRKISDSKAETANDKGKRSKNVNTEETKEKESDPEIGLEIMAKREWKRLRNSYLEMQGRNVDKMNPEKEESSEKDVKEEKSDRVSFTPEVLVNIDNEMEPSCRGPKNFKGACLVNRDENVVLNHNASHNLSAKIEGDLQDVLGQDLSDEFRNTYQGIQSRNHLPHRLIGLMCQLDLSVLCNLRKFKFKHKYPALSLGFGVSEIDKFNNIVLCYEEKSICIQVENVEKRYTEDISYDRLFTKGNKHFSINNYFNSFVQHLFSKAESSSNTIEYLIICTNSSLDLTEEMRFKQGRSKKCYPFKFDSLVKCDILKDFLLANCNTKKQGFYQFSQDKKSREEFLKHLQFSSAMQKVITERQLSQGFEKEVKEDFFGKLVFVVNQPNRQELNRIIKNEIKNSKFQYYYRALQEEVLHDLTAVEKYKKLEKSVNYIPRIMYKFNLLILLLHDMVLHKSVSSITSDTSNDISVYYKDKVTHVKVHTADSKIGYSQLFSSATEKKNPFSINSLFIIFIEKLKQDVEHFIFYTNADLDLTEENTLKPGRSKEFYPLKFDIIDIRKKKYKMLRHFSCIDENSPYQFARAETREKLLSLLKLPPLLQKEKVEARLSDENEKEIKEKFLDKLIFAVSQPDKEKLNSALQTEVERSNKSKEVPYNYEELREIALRWSESDEVGPITERIIKEIFEDIKNNRLSYQKTRNKNIDEEIKFAKSVFRREGTSTFHKFLDILIQDQKLELLKREGINPANMSSILHGAATHATIAFKDLYHLWFDLNGKKTQCLKTLEEKGINLNNVSGILNGAGVHAAKAFKDLHDLWFDEKGNKSEYLQNLEEEEIDLANISSILRGAGAKAAKTFKELYDIWFDDKGNKTQYLKSLEEEGVHLINMSSILNGAGANAARAFEDLYNVWFDSKGNKTQYLKNLEEDGVNLANMSSILKGAGANAANAFQELYDLWFDATGNRTPYLKALEEEGINIINMSSILNGTGAKAAKAFINLYNLWFGVEGFETQYLKTLDKEGVSLASMSSILSGAGNNSAKAFKDLHDLWFDLKGYKTEYLKTLEESGITLANVSSILHGAGAKAAKSFKELYDLWFDVEGSKTKYLKTIQENGIDLSDMSNILNGAGVNASKSFQSLYGLWFDAKGNKTYYLKTVEKGGVNLDNLCSILNGAGINAAKGFQDLYDLWFDAKGNKTKYLITLEREGINLSNMSGSLCKSGAKAAKAFKDLYDLWFDVDGNKTQYLKTIKKMR